MDIAARNRLATVVRVLTGVGGADAAPVPGVIWVVVSGWPCGEAGDYPDAHGHYPADSTWHQIPGAWQWSALAWMGAAGFVLAVAFAVALIARRRSLAPALAVATAAAAIAPWVFQSVA